MLHYIKSQSPPPLRLHDTISTIRYYCSSKTKLSSAVRAASTTTVTTPSCDSSILIREATADDYSSVIKIDEGLYMGRDYLPHTYHRAISTPCTKAVVCVDHADIIGYAAGHLVDGGRTLVLSSGRVKNSHRNQGHTKRMLEDIRSHFRFQSGNPKQEVLVTKGKDLMQNKPSFHEEYTEVLRKTLVNFIIPKNKQLRRHATQEQHSIQSQGRRTNTFTSQINDEEAKSMLTETLLSDSFAVKAELFGSSDFLITNWTPYGTSPQNAEDILKSNDIVLLSGANNHSPETLYYYRNDTHTGVNNYDSGYKELENHQYPTKWNHNTKNENVDLIKKEYSNSDTPIKIETERIGSERINFKQFSETCDGVHDVRTNGGASEYPNVAPPVFSVGNYFPCKLGLAYNIDLYSKDDIQLRGGYKFNNSDLEAVATHMKFHIKHAMGQDFEKAIHLIVFVSASRDYQRALVCNVMDSWFSLEPEQWDTKCLHLYRKPIS